MDRFDRIFFLRNLLIQRRIPIPLSEIEQELECSRATANRTIKILRDNLNAPLVYDRDRNGYYFADGDGNDIRFELPGLWLNASELYALLVSDQLLSEVRPGLLKDHIKPLRSRIEKLLKKGRYSSQNPEHRIRILQMASRPANLKVFRDISTAVLSRKRLHILLMCQHFSGHKVTPFLENFRSLPVNNNDWRNEVVFDCRIPQYIRIYAV